MATMITDECINCGACEPECPNTAIYQGGVEYEWQGGNHAALTNEFFYIVPEKCTECVGFYDHEACAAVCPDDCCVPNPTIVEAESLLLQRAREIHPDKTFADDAPSRFKQDGAAAALISGAAIEDFKPWDDPYAQWLKGWDEDLAVRRKLVSPMPQDPDQPQAGQIAVQLARVMAAWSLMTPLLAEAEISVKSPEAAASS